GRKFPWGDNIEFSFANHRDSGQRKLEPVTARPRGASPFGCLNMAGNAAEWTITPLETPGPDGQKEVIRVRGGGYDDDLIMCRAAFWNEGSGKDDPHPAIGFRCAQDVER
ncbi:SUMF1/EgtB/PvdO family nonheme iron enzyme, partial [bacterium]|nr:SUMF1/EgtB/PvdO family nonheme iron enzyme [bacterium]